MRYLLILLLFASCGAEDEKDIFGDDPIDEEPLTEQCQRLQDDDYDEEQFPTNTCLCLRGDSLVTFMNHKDYQMNLDSIVCGYNDAINYVVDFGVTSVYTGVTTDEGLEKYITQVMSQLEGQSNSHYSLCFE